MTAVSLGGELRTEFGDDGHDDAGGSAVLLGVVEAAVDGFSVGFDAAVLTATDAADAVRRLAVVERKVVAAKAQAARRVDGSQIWKHAGFRTAAEWMAAQTGDTVGATTGLLDTVKKLDGCRATRAAFTAGDVSVAAAREIAGAVAVDPGSEKQLLAVVASGGSHRELVDKAARVRQAARSAEDEAARYARLRARRFARTRVDADGLLILTAGFVPQDWAVHADRWRRATDVEFARARRQGRRESTDAYAADALLAMLAAGATPPAATNPPIEESPLVASATADSPPPDDTAARPPRLDELVGAAGDSPTETDYPTESPPPKAPTSAPRLLPPGARAEVIVLVDGIALQRGYVGVGERCEIVGVGPVELDWVNQLLPEAIVHALVHDGVDITTYASATRSIRKAVRLAVKARDWRCVVRRCGNARFVQQDHRRQFAHSGAGSSDNLNLLCVFHHNQKSRDGARLERRGDEWHWYPPKVTDPWISPVGATLTLWNVEPP